MPPLQTITIDDEDDDHQNHHHQSYRASELCLDPNIFSVLYRCVAGVNHQSKAESKFQSMNKHCRPVVSTFFFALAPGKIQKIFVTHRMIIHSIPHHNEKNFYITSLALILYVNFCCCCNIYFIFVCTQDLRRKRQFVNCVLCLIHKC